MSDTTQHNHKEEENLEHLHLESTDAEFTCPNCGKIERDDVVFLCNTCPSSEMIYKEGMYMCPSCLAPGDNFECMICESKDVKMELKQKK
ncbi:hypothetical protein HN803_06430 [candidate division WWE3 bacterium]|jgi:predicted RNA-binding Zn-ribbon protein involved in translation (DUF1610 family)|nr:hypothetical protein [candidate division WWE3 bacterium]MBT7350393.1 hypothetical protein [candidate division WWE3 bacterium]